MVFEIQGGTHNRTGIVRRPVQHLLCPPTNAPTALRRSVRRGAVADARLGLA